MKHTSVDFTSLALLAVSTAAFSLFLVSSRSLASSQDSSLVKATAPFSTPTATALKRDDKVVFSSRIAATSWGSEDELETEAATLTRVDRPESSSSALSILGLDDAGAIANQKTKTSFSFTLLMMVNNQVRIKQWISNQVKTTELLNQGWKWVVHEDDAEEDEVFLDGVLLSPAWGLGVLAWRRKNWVSCVLR